MSPIPSRPGRNAPEHKRTNQLSEEEDNAKQAEKADTGSDFDYILGMPLWSLTQERYQEHMKKRDAKIEEMKALKLKTPADLYRTDLDEFEERYKGLDEAEQENSAPTTSGTDSPKKPKAKGKGGKRRGGARTTNNADTLPSSTGMRVEPTINVETIAKFEKAKELKERKAAGEPTTKRVRKMKDPSAAPAKRGKKETKEKDSEGEQRNGTKFKQTTLDSKVEKKPKRKGADSDDESSFHSSELSSDEEEEEVILSSDEDEKPPKKPAAPKRKRDISPEMEEENIDTNVGKKKTAVTKERAAVVHATDDEEEGVKSGQLPADGAPASQKEVKQPEVKKATKITSLYSSDEEEEPVKVIAKKPAVKKEAPKPTKRVVSESPASDEDVIVPRARTVRMAAAKKFVFQDSASEAGSDDDYVMDTST